jgi:hypothetical protein
MKNNNRWFLQSVNGRLKMKSLEVLSFLSMSRVYIRFVLILACLNCSYYSFSQKPDSTKVVNNFATAVTITNNGISFIPTFSLGKPAAIFDLSVGRKLSFDPQLRFSLEGKPWSFLFWWRYKLLSTDKFLLKIGGHPALSFKTSTITVNGLTKDAITAQRYLAGELSPNYLLTKNISIGVYYLYSRGIEKDATRNTHFLTLNSNFSNIKLGKLFYTRFTPQFYYLKMDNKDGFYFTSQLTLARRNFPLSASVIMNKIIKTEITASKNFVWSASLVYSFSKKYVER